MFIKKLSTDAVEHDEIKEAFPEAEYRGVAYFYEAGDYDGSGFIAGIRNDGEILGFNMGHCSCYGPLDDGWNGDKRKPEKVDESKNALDHDGPQDAVMEYLKRNGRRRK